MFRSRWRKVFRDVWARKTRTAMTSIAIFVGVLGVVTLSSSGDLLISQLKHDLKQEELAMQAIFVSAPGGVQLENASYLEALEAFPGVTLVEGRAVRPLSWKLPGDAKFEDGFIRAAWEPFEQIRLEPMRLTGRGQYPSTGRHQIAIEKRMAEKHGLNVGDQIVLRVVGADAGEEAWTISGIVFTPYPSYSGAGPLELPVPSDARIFATFEDAQAIAGFVGVGAFLVRYSDFPTAKEQSDRLYATIAQETPYAPVFNLVDHPAESSQITEVGEITSILSILGVIAMVVSGLLVVNIINSIVGEQKRQIGVMKSLGATRWDNFVMYVGIAMTYGVIGTIPGVVVGSYLGFLMAQAIGQPFGAFVEGFSLSPSGILIGVVMGLAVPFVAAIVPVFLGTRVTILEAMTDVGISGNYGKGLWARAINVMPLPTNTKQTISNVTRKKGRLALTWLTLAVAAFMGIFAVFASINDKIGGIFDALGYEIVVVPNERQDFDQLSALISEGVDGINAIYPGVIVAVELEVYINPDFETSQLEILGIDPATDSLNLDIKTGSGWKDDPAREGIVLSSTVADQIDKDAGDTVVLVAQGQSAELEIIGIASFATDQGFMEWRALARLVGSTLASGDPAPTALLVQTTRADPSVNEVDDIIDEIDDILLSNGIAAAQANRVKTSEDIAQLIALFGLIFESAAIVMVAVGAIGLLSTLSLSVFERQREIGVMRSIGASSFTVASQFLTEGMLVGISAFIVAAPLSYLLGLGLISSLDITIEGIGYEPIALVIGLIGLIVITVLASLGPSLGAARRTVSSILRYQ